MNASSVQPSQDAIDLITKWEAFKPGWYVCPAGVETIGFGTTRPLLDELGGLADIGGPITKEEGYTLLEASLMQHFVPKLARRLETSLQQYQIDALTSFVYNVGIRAFDESTMRSLYNAGKEDAAEKEFLKWVYADGEKLPGLVARRREEKALAERDERIDVELEGAEPLPPVSVATSDPGEVAATASLRAQA